MITTMATLIRTLLCLFLITVMKQRLLSLMLVAISSASFAGQSPSQMDILKVEHQRVQAIKNNDRATLEKITSSDYIEIASDGKFAGKKDALTETAQRAIASRDLKVQI